MLAGLITASCQIRDDLQPESQNTGKPISEKLSASSIIGADDLNCADATVSGPVVFFNGARMWSFITIKNMQPKEVGINIQNVGFQNLPNANAPEYTEILLPLPTVQCDPLLFDHLTFHWNPDGHDPDGTYSVPHFDFHFYTISLTERLAISDTDPSILYPPASTFLPIDYYGPIGPISAMGAHWVDLQAPEFTGDPFSRTILYGSNNGQVTFQEPMATLAYLTSNPNLSEAIPIRQPAQYARSGYYPMKYKIKRNSTYTTISLIEFVYMSGSASPPIM